MKRIILTSAALTALGLFGFAPILEAAPPPHGHPAPVPHAPAHVHVAPAHVAHTHALVIHGHPVHVPVHVRAYHGWGWRCWFPSFNCYGYYSVEDQVWYYWYAPFDEYLPITYMSMYPPTVYPPTGVVAPVTVAPIAPGVPALPPGASYVPGPIAAP
jgi:hypothetical protein